MGANPHANGGLLLRDLHLPDFRSYARRTFPSPGTEVAEATRVLGRHAARRDEAERGDRIISASSGRMKPLPTVWARCLRSPTATSTAEIFPVDDHVSPDGRVMEVLSEHMCQGWLEGYLLTGRHGFFSCYEAFIHIIDSMFNQHAKWLKVTRDIPWRRPIASLNYLLTSHVWRQDHNGFSHQDPGFHRSRGQQKGRRGARLSSARRQLPALGGRSLPAQPQLRERDRRRQAAGAAVARYGCGHQALHRRHRHLGLGQQRSGRRARRGDGLLRRCSHA